MLEWNLQELRVESGWSGILRNKDTEKTKGTLSKCYKSHIPLSLPPHITLRGISKILE